jgi:hypothetical protein
MCTSERKEFPSFSRKKTTPLHFERSIIMSNSLSPFFRGKFLVGDQENNGLALIFLIDNRARELQFDSRAIVGEML